MVHSAGGDGAEVVYALRNSDTLAKQILDNIGATGQNVRKYYQRKLPSDPTKDYYFIIRDTAPAESLLIEYAFIDSTGDDKKQIKEHYEDLAEATVKAIADYKGYNYTEPNQNSANESYTVQKGDSLWSIAKRFNVSVDKIKEYNNLSSNLISIGENLTIPGVAPTSQTNTTYIVQKGDSLWSIANANNTTIDEIANLNDLTNNTIYVGQTLQIPNTGSSGAKTQTSTTNTYVVQKGDNLYTIAKKYNVTQQSIKDLNNLLSDTLIIGQTLTIPGEVESTGNENITTPSTSNNTTTYMVQKGDSLWSIARAYDVTVSELKAANNLTSDLLSVGQVLTIPDVSKRSYSNLYIIRRGDSLWSIANMFNVSINDLRMLNNLSTDIISIGQTLIIPQ